MHHANWCSVCRTCHTDCMLGWGNAAGPSLAHLTLQRFAQSLVPPLRGCVADAHCGYGIILSNSLTAATAPSLMDLPAFTN